MPFNIVKVEGTGWLYSVQQVAATDNKVTSSHINVDQPKLNDVELESVSLERNSN